MCYIFEKLGGSNISNMTFPCVKWNIHKGTKWLEPLLQLFVNILICVVVLKITHNINTCKDHGISYHAKVYLSKAPRCPTDAIFYCILVVVSIRSTAVLYYKLKVQLGKWDNNLTLSYNRFTDAGSVSNCHAVAASRELWILPLATNGDWVFLANYSFSSLFRPDRMDLMENQNFLGIAKTRGSTW